MSESLTSGTPLWYQMAMDVQVHATPAEMGAAAAQTGERAVAAAIAATGAATIVVATGTSQFTVLEHLARSGIDWSKVTAFHLDEYVGISTDHPASFVRYLRERFVSRLPDLGTFAAIDGTAPPAAEARRLSALIKKHEIDAAFIGIGENAHLAFNDPPADFSATDPYLVVALDDACRRQQVGEGWFASLDEVPRQAISMSISRIMTAATLVVSVPDERKADAVRCAVEGPVDPHCPASMLQRHENCHLFLDRAAASRLSTRARGHRAE